MYAHASLSKTSGAASITTCVQSVMLAWLLLATAPVLANTQAPSVDALQTEVAGLRERVATLEQQLQEVLLLVRQQVRAGQNTPAKPQAPAQKPVPAGETGSGPATVTTTDNSAVSVGGRIKLDAIYNSHSTGGNSGSNSGDLEFLPATIPVNSYDERNQISFNARQTRLWLKGYSPSSYGPVAGYIEIDFDSSTSASNEKVSNSYVPRLRHAYGSLGGWTLGQTYTTFMNISAYPEVNDLNGPAGIIHVRQPLIQYRFDADWGNLALAMENPETTLITTTGGHIAPDADRLPDFVAKTEFKSGWGNWSLAGLVREIRSDGAVPGKRADSNWGGAISSAGRITLGGQDNLRFNLAYGNALGRYLSFNAYDDGVIDSNGRISLTSIVGGYLAWQHWWTNDLRSNAAVGYAHADQSRVDPASNNENFYSTHLNLLWSPSLNSSVGIEWLHAYRELVDGSDGEIDRIQITSSYKF